MWRRLPRCRNGALSAARLSVGPISPRSRAPGITSKGGSYAGKVHILFKKQNDFNVVMFGFGDHTKWFMLWNAHGGDTTMINGIRRGHFRLHPEGPMRLSQGCITVVSPFAFDSLRRYIRSHQADLPVPGSTLRAYGTVEVR
ncbi:tlde1 domain-containing protein [Paraburkholderia ginsengiterrae]|uniref:tlde1 domain-containing protein n=1 Tax=Paraburkholderia ginsengiterrae TaxID=1462993 RepID=UPI0009EEA75D|nr:tlde1 domain-containing protein [Paraburkholderia ginsengiterrae]